MAKDKFQLNSSGVRKLNSSGQQILADTADPCCCNSNVCFTKFTINWDCAASTWGAWTNAGDFCLDPATTSTARTFTSRVGNATCSYQQFVRKTPDVSCTANADCTSSASAPAVPTDTPASDCLCAQCGCSHTMPFNVRVTVAGSAGVGCFAAADNTGSASVVGNIDGTYDLDRVSGACAYVKVFPGPTMHRDCFSNNCTHGTGNCAGGGDPLDSPVCNISVRVARSGANSWRITVTSSGGATLYYDSGNFAWNDQSLCDGTGSGAQADTLVGNVLPTGCNPTSIAMGATASAIAL